MQLHELIFIQGLFLLDSVTDIMRMIELQPSKDIFFKSFMELDHSNLIQILSFESRFIDKLLQDTINNSQNYNPQYPIFYKMQQQNKENTSVLTPVGLALENNQIIALNKMIEYIVVF